jgi:hypothetical protein
VGWFGTAASDVEDPVRHVVSVRGAENGKIVGGGLLLGSTTVLTCAHVVNAALDRPMLEPRSPGLGQVAVEIGDDAGGARRFHASVAHWIAPRTRDGGPVPAGADEWLGDLAVLRIAGSPGGLPAAPRLTAMAPGQRVTAWHGSGEAATYARLTVHGAVGARAYLDGAPTGMAVGPGYSGGPLWCGTEQAVVGLVVAHFMPPRDRATGAALPHSPQHRCGAAGACPGSASRKSCVPWACWTTRRPGPPTPTIPPSCC